MNKAKINKQWNSWYHRNKEKYRPIRAALMRKYRAKNPEKYAAQSREAKRKQRAAMFLLYGCKCVLCGFSDKRALTLDHVRNNGAEERARLGPRGVYRRALNPKNKGDYRMLCMNCQFVTRHESGRENQYVKITQL